MCTWLVLKTISLKYIYDDYTLINIIYEWINGTSFNIQLCGWTIKYARVSWMINSYGTYTWWHVEYITN